MADTPSKKAPRPSAEFEKLRERAEEESEQWLQRTRPSLSQLSEVFLPSPEKPLPLVTQTRMPTQPSDVPAGHLWAGPRWGVIPYSGVKPQPGDLLSIVGGPARRYATSSMAGEALRWPTFTHGCKCKCPNRTPTGTAFYTTVVRQVTNVLAIDVATAEVRQFFGMNELGGDRGTVTGRVTPIAVSPKAPYDLFVLDDRRSWFTRQTDTTLAITRGYFTLVRYAVTAGQYAPVEYTDLPDPGIVGIVEQDPPSVYTNCLAVVGGIPTITLQNAPARYLSVSGGTTTTHALLLNGTPYASGLRGNIVTGLDRPASSNSRYVVATVDGLAHEVLEFDANDVIRQRVALPGLSHPWHLAAFCNRLLVLNGALTVAVIET